ncbi:MAG: hypothetical protein QCH99_04810 [Candidatus Bathyarchaeota archaeon]|nr:hypothetical protein [Candidatus Bathyarchaeum tardum]
MTRNRLSNSLIGAFGGAGGSLVLFGLIRHFTSIFGISLGAFLTIELCGIFLISIAVYIFLKH